MNEVIIPYLLDLFLFSLFLSSLLSSDHGSRHVIPCCIKWHQILSHASSWRWGRKHETLSRGIRSLCEIFYIRCTIVLFQHLGFFLALSPRPILSSNASSFSSSLSCAIAPTSTIFEWQRPLPQLKPTFFPHAPSISLQLWRELPTKLWHPIVSSSYDVVIHLLLLLNLLPTQCLL